MFDRIDFRGEGFIDARIGAIGAADANGDSIVDFDEWFSKLKSYVKAAFDVLDQNQDGSILDEAREGNILNSISYRFFEELLNQLFDLFDSNNDGAISLEDGSFRVFSEAMFSGVGGYMFYGTRHGKMTLSEYFGVDLITLPAPIYNFYEKVTTVASLRMFAIFLIMTLDMFSFSTSAGQRQRREVDSSRSLGLHQQTVHPDQQRPGQ